MLKRLEPRNIGISGIHVRSWIVRQEKSTEMETENEKRIILRKVP